jgi:hypothetical protein
MSAGTLKLNIHVDPTETKKAIENCIAVGNESYGSAEHRVAARSAWSLMGSACRDQLVQLLKGPTWDGDVLSKRARDYLIHFGLATRCCKDMEQGYAVATYYGYEIWKYGKDEV